MEIDNLIKYRSLRKCLHEGFVLYSNNLKLLLRKLYFHLLVSAFCLSTLLYIIVRHVILADNVSPWSWLFVILCALASIVAVGVTIRKETRLVSEKLRMKEMSKMLMRNFGSFFQLLLLSAIVCLVLMVIAALPIIVLIYAMATNYNGVLLGDAEGLPSLFPLYFILVSMFSFFVMGYIQVWQTISTVYCYGAVTAKAKRQ